MTTLRLALGALLFLVSSLLLIQIVRIVSALPLRWADAGPLIAGSITGLGVAAVLLSVLLRRTGKSPGAAAVFMTGAGAGLSFAGLILSGLSAGGGVLR